MVKKSTFRLEETNFRWFHHKVWLVYYDFLVVKQSNFQPEETETQFLQQQGNNSYRSYSATVLIEELEQITLGYYILCCSDNRDMHTSTLLSAIFVIILLNFKLIKLKL